MKIVAVSDTHTDYAKLIVPDGDVFVHAGDIDLNNMRDAIRFNKWLGTLPHKYKIIVGGNHDKWLEQTNYHLKIDILRDCIYLENKGIEIEGVKFWGSPMTPMFNDWHFMANRGEDIRRYWDMIPSDTDVIITHGPPKRILDATPRGIWFDYVGCDELLARIQQIKPKVHISGHIHFSHGTEQHGDTRFYNVSVMNEEYEIVNEPTQIII